MNSIWIWHWYAIQIWLICNSASCLFLNTGFVSYSILVPHMIWKDVVYVIFYKIPNCNSQLRVSHVIIPVLSLLQSHPIWYDGNASYVFFFTICNIGNITVVYFGYIFNVAFWITIPGVIKWHVTFVQWNSKIGNLALFSSFKNWHRNGHNILKKNIKEYHVW